MDQIWEASENFAEKWILKVALKGCVEAYQADTVYFGLSRERWLRPGMEGNEEKQPQQR